MAVKLSLTPNDALIIVDVQNDFLPGGRLAVPRGDDVIQPLNCYIEQFLARQLMIVATRDWHPENHCSFTPQGGIWPPHCVQNSEGAAFAERLQLPASALVISKATEQSQDAYSAFQGTGLADTLQAAKITHLYVGGLATDYCVLNTVLDGLTAGFNVSVLRDATQPVNLQPDDGDKALVKMQQSGATLLDGLQAA